MYETGRRSAISTSELGLYSDRAERYTRGKYGPVVRKFVIVVMAVVAVVLAAIFVYDFASGASATSKVSQETKRIYILQNALKKPSGGSLPKRESSGRTIAPPDHVINGTSRAQDGMQDRSDDAQQPRDRQLAYVAHSERRRSDDQRAETRSQALENFKHRKRLVESAGGEEEEEEEKEDPKDEIRREVEGKQLFDNHALVYRVRQTRYKYPDPEEEFHMQEAEEEEASRPAPFRFELKTPQPASFDKRLKFPQLAQYRYPHASRNIQDIIKYLSDDPNATKRGIKFTGVYVNPKKYDLYPEAGETMANSERNEYQADRWRQEDDYGHDDNEEEEEEEEDDDDDDDHEFSQSSRYATVGNNGDPFYRYKPKHPTDVNLLAPSNVRFSPSGSQRYNPYYDPFFQRPAPSNYARPMPAEVLPQYVDNAAAHSNGNYRKRKKPKPFSVMLDIYPITDLNEQAPSNKVSRPRLPPVGIDDYDPRRPVAYTRGQRHRHPPPPALPLPQPQSIPLVAASAAQAGLVDEDERQQMIFHLNLYPRKKNKHNRNDIIQRSESMRPEDREKLMHSVMSPFDAITKHITDHSAIEESKYEESELPETSAPSSLLTEPIQPQNDHSADSTDSTDSTNSSNDEVSERDPKVNFTGGNDTFSTENKFMNSSINVDTPEGFQAFADGLLATE